MQRRRGEDVEGRWGEEDGWIRVREGEGKDGRVEEEKRGCIKPM